jgi:hypothetical protein
MKTQHMNCCATVLLRYYGNATGCIGHVTKGKSNMSQYLFRIVGPMCVYLILIYYSEPIAINSADWIDLFSMLCSANGSLISYSFVDHRTLSRR